MGGTIVNKGMRARMARPTKTSTGGPKKDQKGGEVFTLDKAVISVQRLCMDPMLSNQRGRDRVFRPNSTACDEQALSTSAANDQEQHTS